MLSTSTESGLLYTEKTEKKPIKISKVNFLIHPGQLSDPNSDRDLLSAGFKFEQSPEQKQQLEKMSEAYLKKAREVQSAPDEIMVAFLHKKGKPFRKDYHNKTEAESGYNKLIKDLKSILGSRLMVLGNDFDIVRDHEEDLNAMELARLAWQTLVKIAKNKGFEIDENVFTEAFGERLLACVEWGSLNLNIANRLKNPTIIDPKISNALIEENGVNKAMQRQKRMRVENDPRLRNISFKSDN